MLYVSVNYEVWCQKNMKIEKLENKNIRTQFYPQNLWSNLGNAFLQSIIVAKTATNFPFELMSMTERILNELDKVVLCWEPRLISKLRLIQRAPHVLHNQWTHKFLHHLIQVHQPTNVSQVISVLGYSFLWDRKNNFRFEHFWTSGQTPCWMQLLIILVKGLLIFAEKCLRTFAGKQGHLQDVKNSPNTNTADFIR